MPLRYVASGAQLLAFSAELKPSQLRLPTHPDTLQTMTDTTAVRRGHTFDVGRLHTYLQANLRGYGGPLKVKQFGFGQSNPTFLLSTPLQQYVLRKKPPGRIVPSAHAVEREFRVLQALGKANARQSSGAGAGAGAGADAAIVPVPAVYLLCTDATVIGTPFYIMEYVRGRIFTDPFMPTESPQHRAACYADAVKVLAALHAASHRDLGLGKFGRPAGYVRVVCRANACQHPLWHV